MTEKDKRLIAEARMLRTYEWESALRLMDMAESAEAKEIIHGIAVRGYHRDEHYSGLEG